jgi:hypothetical protein
MGKASGGWFVRRCGADQAAAPDRRRITAFQGTTAIQRPRQVSELLGAQSGTLRDITVHRTEEEDSMTCQVAVMNKNGLALATDSAVTLGPQRKVYHSTDKLFRLSEAEPVAVMTYGSAELLGVPWEIIIKTYRRKLGNRRFDFLDQYAEDFLRYLESANPLFPEDAQHDAIRDNVRSYWLDRFLRDIWRKFGEDTATWPEAAWTKLSESVKADATIWEQCESLSGVGLNFGERIVSTYLSTLKELQTRLFHGVDVPSEIDAGFLHAVRMMHEKRFWPPWFSGVVIAGFGEQEPFPKVVHFSVNTVVAGHLLYAKLDEGQVTRSDDAYVMPFAQTHMVNLFYRGVFPSLEEHIVQILRGVLSKHLEPPDPDETESNSEGSSLAESIVGEFMERFKKETGLAYTKPLMTAVGALPLNELCSLAEALVSLTVFRARMSADEASETVGGDIDVAAISKGDGFAWVHRKELVGKNPRQGRITFV